MFGRFQQRSDLSYKYKCKTSVSLLTVKGAEAKQQAMQVFVFILNVENT